MRDVDGIFKFGISSLMIDEKRLVTKNMSGSHSLLCSRAAPPFDVVSSRCVDAREMSATSTIIMVWLRH